MQHGHSRVNCGHRRQLLAGIGTLYRANLRIHIGEIATKVAAQHPERQTTRARLIRVGHGGMRMLLDGERMRPALLDRVPEPVQGADAGIAAPGKHQPVGAAHADHLVVDEVGRHAHQMQAATALPNDLVTGSKRDEMGKTL